MAKGKYSEDGFGSSAKKLQMVSDDTLKSMPRIEEKAIGKEKSRWPISMSVGKHVVKSCPAVLTTPD